MIERSIVHWFWLLVGSLIAAAWSTFAAANDGPGSPVTQFLETVRAKAWVTAFVDSSNPRAVPSSRDLMVVRFGDGERIVYRLQQGDLAMSEPVLSLDARWAAFVKTEQTETERQAGRARRYLYVMKIDGTSLRRLVEVWPETLGLRGCLQLDKRGLVTRQPETRGVREPA
jgi:hypothetical protein